MLKNKLVDTISFLENLAVKDGQEKDLFFKRLPAAIPSIPTPVAQRKLLPMLASEHQTISPKHACSEHSMVTPVHWQTMQLLG